LPASEAGGGSASYASAPDGSTSRQIRSHFFAAAMGLIALGRMQRNQWTLRLLILAGGAFWSLHDFLVGSWIALAADLLSLTIGLAMLTKMAVTETVRPRARAPAGAVS
jgi:hypothetical protein